ncbi:DNA polymerase III subunit delta [Oleispirillum naphthae]|uniref:DNA polymerase III subunit delta n=1 Tax=Oleispirillum naphthae TaxID=2838853 RepID=UPI00308236A3
MSKLAGSAADSFIRRPDPAVRAVLLHGPDEGQVRERALTLSRAICPDPDDPFRVADIPPTALKDDPARLFDECSALAFGGGQRVVRVSGLTDAQAAPVLSFLAGPVGEALLIVTAGVLPPRSKLRSGFETSKVGAALACYPPEGAQLLAALRTACAEAGVTLSREGLEELAARLADDTACLKAEVEKLRLYLGNETRPLTPEDVRACCGDQSEHSVFELAFAVADGAQKAIQGICDRLFAAGDSPIAILRGVARHFDRLLQARGAVDAGTPPDQAMKELRPAVFFKDATTFRRQLGAWTGPTLLAALDRLVEVERQCKSTGIPANLVTQRGLMEIAALANRTRRR